MLPRLRVPPVEDTTETSGSKSPGVVLVHGIVSTRYLLPTVRELARVTRVLVPDMPGFARDAPPGRMPGVAEHADAVAAAIDDWGGAGATVVGHSIGAEVVVELGQRHPSLVGRAVLAGPTGDPSAGGVLGLCARWLATAVSEPLSFNLLALAELVTLGPSRMVQLARRSFADPVEPKLRHLVCPTLLVRGERDRVAPRAWLDRMASRVPDAVVVTVPGAAHTLVYTHPGRLAELVVGFGSGRFER